jgi:hypothetical protein
VSILSSLLGDLKANAVEALQAAGQSVEDSVIVNGDIAWDDRCGGYVYVRYAGASPLGGDHRCAVPLLVHSIYVGVLRCVSTVDDEGVAPATDVLTEEALEAVVDSEALFQMLNCDFNWRPYGDAKRIIGWVPLGPEGGYGGGEWQVDVRIPPPCGC